VSCLLELSVALRRTMRRSLIVESTAKDQVEAINASSCSVRLFQERTVAENCGI